MRIGHGYDVHRMVEGRKCILCGVTVPSDKGPLGHSDADVAVHALIDALLGAAALGDIGKLFPDSDEQYRDISSMKLLDDVVELLAARDYSIGNVDITIVLKRPKLSEYIGAMRASLAEGLHAPVDCVSVKATTEEGLGVSGNGEGIAAHAVALIV